jgi:hypothetical protein
MLSVSIGVFTSIMGDELAQLILMVLTFQIKDVTILVLNVFQTGALVLLVLSHFLKLEVGVQHQAFRFV